MTSSTTRRDGPSRRGARGAAAVLATTLGVLLSEIPGWAQNLGVLTRIGAGAGTNPTAALVQNGNGFDVTFPPVGLNGNNPVSCFVSGSGRACAFASGGTVLFVHQGIPTLIPIDQAGPLPNQPTSLASTSGIVGMAGGSQIAYATTATLPKPPGSPLSVSLTTPSIQTVTLPGAAASPAFSTQALAFDPMTGRSYVCHNAGISVVDPPYTAVAFTVPLAGCTGVATAPDGSVVAAVTLSNRVFMYAGPLTAASAAESLVVNTGSVRLEGLTFTADGSRIITAAVDTPDLFVIAPPYTVAGASVEPVSLSAVGGWEHVAVSPDNQFVLGAGAPNTAGRADPNIPLGRFPFGPGDFSTLAIPGGRGGGAVAFVPEPPCSAGVPGVALSPPASSGVAGLAAAGPLFSSVLPLSRSVRVGCLATAFVTVINAGTETATNVSIASATSIPAAFLYQATDANNAPIGSPNTPVSIPAGKAQSFVIGFVPTAPFPPTDVALKITGTNTDPVQVLPAVNTLKLAAAPARTPDPIALVATLTGDGIANIPKVGDTGVFAVASVNVGISAVITVSGDTGTGTTPLAAAAAATLPVNISVCQTNTATGACLSPPTASVTTPVAAGATPSFAFFVTATGPVPFDPANNRVFARFRDALGVERGSTSVAIRIP